MNYDIIQIIGLLVPILFYGSIFLFFFFLKRKREKEMPENIILELGILSTPLRIDKEDVANYDSNVYYVNDEQIVFDNSNRVQPVFLFFGIGLFVPSMVGIISSGDFLDFENNKYLSLCILPLSFVLFYFAFGNIRKRFVFDRLKGTVKYPDLWFRYRTIPFAEAHFITRELNIGAVFLGILHKNNVSWSNLTVSDRSVYNLWSTLVWYMDKNRPLPPGTAFDPVRQSDYERRKKEGFPPPLYPSYIPETEVSEDLID
jgi:hypothetical protein